MNPETTPLEALVDSFASEWLLLRDPLVATRLIADPILVLGPEGTAPVPRLAFLAAVTARAGAVNDLADQSTTFVGAAVHPLGDRMVLATISWSFSYDGIPSTLVSDFLLQREGQDALRCVAYLPRTNVLDHVAG